PRFSMMTSWPSLASSRWRVMVMPGSSSMSRIRFFMICRASQNDAKRGAAMHPGLILQHAAMFFNDAGGNGEAQACAGFLGREERIEEAFLHFWRNAATGIGHFKDDHIDLHAGKALAVQPGAQGHHAIATDRIGCILDEIDEDLFDLLGIGANQGGRGSGI